MHDYTQPTNHWSIPLAMGLTCMFFITTLATLAHIKVQKNIGSHCLLLLLLLLSLLAVSRIFLRVFLKKYKLCNLIKREINILITTSIKKIRKYIKFTIVFLWVFIFFQCMIVSLSMLQAISLLMYITKQSFIYWM